MSLGEISKSLPTLALTLTPWHIIVGLSVVLLLALIPFVRHRRAIGPFLGRSDQRERRVAEFGEEHTEFIDKLLCVFCIEFGFPRRLRYKLSPEDKVSVYYEEHYREYPYDAMEYEAFYQGLLKEFRLDFNEAEMATDATLSELLRTIVRIKFG